MPSLHSSVCFVVIIKPRSGQASLVALDRSGAGESKPNRVMEIARPTVGGATVFFIAQHGTAVISVADFEQQHVTVRKSDVADSVDFIQ
jgi:hypothetical protein